VSTGITPDGLITRLTFALMTLCEQPLNDVGSKFDPTLSGNYLLAIFGKTGTLHQ